MMPGVETVTSGGMVNVTSKWWNHDHRNPFVAAAVG
jgi:hypothetical protein